MMHEEIKRIISHKQPTVGYQGVIGGRCVQLGGYLRFLNVGLILTLFFTLARHRGELNKQGHIVKNWKRRSFVLTEGELTYFSGEYVVHISSNFRLFFPTILPLF